MPTACASAHCVPLAACESHGGTAQRDAHLHSCRSLRPHRRARAASWTDVRALFSAPIRRRSAYGDEWTPRVTDRHEHSPRPDFEQKQPVVGGSSRSFDSGVPSGELRYQQLASHLLHRSHRLSGPEFLYAALRRTKWRHAQEQFRRIHSPAGTGRTQCSGTRGGSENRVPWR